MRCASWVTSFVLIALCGCKDDAPSAAHNAATLPIAPVSAPSAAPLKAIAKPAPEPEYACTSVDDHDLIAVIRCFYVTDAPLNLADKWHWLTADEQKQFTEAEWKEKIKSDPAKPACVSSEITMLSNPDLTLPGEKLVSRHVRCPNEDGKNKTDEVVTDTWVNEAGHWRWRQGQPSASLGNSRAASVPSAKAPIKR